MEEILFGDLMDREFGRRSRDIFDKVYQKHPGFSEQLVKVVEKDFNVNHRQHILIAPKSGRHIDQVLIMCLSSFLDILEESQKNVETYEGGSVIVFRKHNKRNIFKITEIKKRLGYTVCYDVIKRI